MTPTTVAVQKSSRMENGSWRSNSDQPRTVVSCVRWARDQEGREKRFYLGRDEREATIRNAMLE